MLTQTKQGLAEAPYTTAASLAGASTLGLAGGPAYMPPADAPSAVDPAGGLGDVRPIDAPSAVGPAGGLGDVRPIDAPSAVAPAGDLGADLVASLTGRLGHSAQWLVALAARIVWGLAGLARRSGRWLVGTGAVSSRRSGELRPNFAHFPGKLRAWLSAAYGVWRTRAADQRGSQITDNLGLVVIGIVAIIAIGGLISGLDKTVFNWVTTQLGLSSGGGAG